MDETNTTTPPTGHPYDPALDHDGPAAASGKEPLPEKLPLTPEGWEYLADLKWVNQEYNLGRFEPYMGNYIAVFRKQLLGFGPDLLALRERMAREHNLSPDRILTTYIDPGIIS